MTLEATPAPPTFALPDWSRSDDTTRTDRKRLEEPPDNSAWRAVFDFERYLKLAAQTVLAKIDAALREDREEAILHGTIPLGDLAWTACKSLATPLAPMLAWTPDLKWAVFGEDSGVVSLVLQSSATDRRVEFTISADGAQISAIRLDNDLRVKHLPLALDDDRGIRESAWWVHNRD